jgi:phosphoglycerate dehydrogenase-like enzyme
MKVLISAASLANLKGKFLDVLLEAGCEPFYPSRAAQLTEDEIFRDLDGARATVAGSEPYTRRVIEAHPQLRVIARVGVGYDAIDVAAATEHGIAVTTTPGANHDAVAEQTFALMLALTKNLVPQHLGTMAGKWPRTTNQPLRRQTLGIAGLGRIGKAVARRGEAFLMKLLAYEPYPDLEFVTRHHIELVSFDELLARSDFLSLHLPYTPESRHLINRKTLARMRPNAFLINTARGGLVNEADLIAVLKAKQIAGAGLDVFEEEPPPPSPLFQLNNVVVTPHAAGGDWLSRDDMAYMAAESIALLKRGEWPAERVVNPHVRQRWSWT